jgi:hypothetical protein
MALPTSGALSLNDIQNEFGGVNPISISEYYAGAGLVPSGTSGINGAVPSSGQISFSIFYGTSAAEIQTVTVGQVFNFFKGEYTLGVGFDSAVNGMGFGPMGLISDGTFNFLGGATIQTLGWATFDSGGTATVYFRVNGSFSNSGWTNMQIQSTNYTRASATYNNNGSRTLWTWGGLDGTTSPFTSEGTNTTVTFT